MGAFSKIVQKARGKKAPLQAVHMQGGILRRKVAEGKWVPVKKQVVATEKQMQREGKRPHHKYRGGHTAPDYKTGIPLHEAEPAFFPGLFEHPSWYPVSTFTRFAMKKVQMKPDATIRVFRAVPAHVDKINEGDWVTLNPKYASDHSHSIDNSKVISKIVRVGDLYTSGDAEEWGWDPQHESVEKGGPKREIGYIRTNKDGTRSKKVRDVKGAKDNWEYIPEEGGGKKRGRKPKAETTAKKKKPEKEKLYPGHQLPKDVYDRLIAVGVSKLPGVAVPKENIIAIQTDDHMECMIKFKDMSGKTQYGYSASRDYRGAQEKFKKITTLSPTMANSIQGLFDTITKKNRFGQDPPQPGDPEHKGVMIALTVALTGMRPGSSMKSSNFGAASLLADHVKITGSKVEFTFVGKGHKDQKYSIDNKVYADNLRPYLEGRKTGQIIVPEKGEKLPALKDREGLDFIFETPTSAYNAAGQAAKENGGFTLKDYRTVIAGEKAKEVLDAYIGPPPPLTGNPQEDVVLLCKAMQDASKVVADRIQNTADVSRRSYVHPEIFRAFMQERCGADKEFVDSIFDKEKVIRIDKVIE